jgi:hypothetical protein
MPTEPMKEILDRELSIAIAKPIIDVASPLLQKLVDYSTYLFARCNGSASGGPDEDIAVFALFHHIMEMIDGIEVLICSSSVSPCYTNLRSAFEAHLSMKFILKENYKQRSLSWLAEFIHRQIYYYQLFDPTSEVWRNVEEFYNKDVGTKNIPLKDPDEAHKEVDRLRSILNKEHFKEIEEEGRKLVNKKGEWPKWHKLFGGPISINKMAIELDEKGQYDILYGHWSSITHAHDFTRAFTDNFENVGRLRNSEDMYMVTLFASLILYDSARLLLEKFRPEEKLDFAKWFLREIQNPLNQLKV